METSIFNILQVVYMIGALTFAYGVDVKKRKGMLMRIGFVVYFPFVALVLLFNRNAFKHYR